jgi:CHAT domain-containing protein/Tfp pilus assembly protein PilF
METPSLKAAIAALMLCTALPQPAWSQTADALRADVAAKEAALGADHLEVAQSLARLAALLYTQARYAEAEPLYKRSLAIRERALGPNHPLVVQSLNDLGVLYRTQGRYAEAEPLYQRSLAISEKTLGPNHPDTATSLNNLGRVLHDQGRFADAEALYRRSLAIREETLGPAHPDVAFSLHNIGTLYWERGRFAEAEPIYERSLAIREKTLPPDDAELARSLNNLALLYWNQGRYAEAEPMYQRSLAIREKTLGPEHPDVAISLNNLALLFYSQGRYAEAETFYKRCAAIAEKALGPNHINFAQALANLARVYADQGRYAEAEPLYLRSLAIREQALGPEHPDVAVNLNALGLLYEGQSRYADAEPLFRRGLAIREHAFGAEHPYVGQSLNNLARLYHAQGRYAEAEPLYLRGLAIREKLLGPAHPDVAISLDNLARLYAAEDRPGVALGYSRRAFELLRTRFSQGAESAGQLAEQRNKRSYFTAHISLLGRSRQPAAAPEANESFEAAQLAQASSVGQSLAQMAARFAAQGGALASAIRQRQDVAARAEALDAMFIREVSRPSAERDLQRERLLRDEEEALRRTMSDLNARLEREFPQYRELADPRPLELAAAQKLLARDEALVVFLVSEDESFVWAVRRGEASFQRLAVGRRDLDALVKKLRAQLDVVDAVDLLRRPFDAAVASELYSKLLAPVQAMLSGVRHLIVVPDGPLQSLPFAVLLTQPLKRPLASIGSLASQASGGRNLGVVPRQRPAPGAGVPQASASSLADYSNAPWLIRKYAITVLPAVSSLRAMRAFARAAPGAEPFTGFGDPILGGNNATSRRATFAALFSRGAVADVDEVRKMQRLPETADELKAIAATLKGPGQLHLGREATETVLKGLDLSRFRNVAFATHGLMAGELKGMAEPALVLTPPDKGSELDDGLLTASEIAQLKLNADWVILSACNTAAPDGTPGAEGLSGLAKAFFYAGARSLLVSHWAVSSDAAVALTTRMFEEAAKGASKAEALQRSMVALMLRRDRAYFAHPAFWAPFIVVGEGNTDWSSRE